MDNKRDNKKFWDRYARLYDFETRITNSKAYAEMYRNVEVDNDANK